MTSPRDTADNDGGYDPAGDPRTGRPPLAVDAEQVRQNAEMEASINEMSVGADPEAIDEGGTSESDESDNPSDIENEDDAD
jgi:hypothetical protein